MQINHNLAALNTLNKLNTAQNTQAKSMQKLSSGLRINSAADDAAGLAISEKMRGQIRGLDQASRNAQDGISMISTAEGALNETHDILQRMRELSVQSSNDTNTADDRKQIQGEVDQMAKEITRISNTTEFNTKNLLAGGLNSTLHIGANQGQNIGITINAMDAKTLGVAGDSIATSLTAANGITGIDQVTADLGAGAKVKVLSTTAASYTPAAGTVGGAITATGSTYAGSTDLAYSFKITAMDGTATTQVNSISYSSDGGTTWATANRDASGNFDLGNNIKIQIADNAGNAVNDTGALTVTAASAQLQLQNTAGTIGSAVTVKSNQSSVSLGDATTGQTANVTFSFASLDATTNSGNVAITQAKTQSKAATTDANGNVSTQATVEKGINVSTQAAASSAITTIDKAIQTVSSERSKLGAFQNRLDHTINNLSTSSENLTSAESRIRDVDYALAA